jgi:hypothetical protein
VYDVLGNDKSPVVYYYYYYYYYDLSNGKDERPRRLCENIDLHTYFVRLYLHIVDYPDDNDGFIGFAKMYFFFVSHFYFCVDPFLFLKKNRTSKVVLHLYRCTCLYRCKIFTSLHWMFRLAYLIFFLSRSYNYFYIYTVRSYSV